MSLREAEARIVVFWALVFSRQGEASDAKPVAVLFDQEMHSKFSSIRPRIQVSQRIKCVSDQNGERGLKIHPPSPTYSVRSSRFSNCRHSSLPRGIYSSHFFGTCNKI